MKLISVNLDGQYKALKDQHFNFRNSTGNIVAFIGLNGSGKSQLMELIAETFAYVERFLRKDFKSNGWIDGLIIEIEYSNQSYDLDEQVTNYKLIVNESGSVDFEVNGISIDVDDIETFNIDSALPSQIIGYSSGLNEGLQRAFMKNAVQYLDTMNLKRQWEVRLANIKNYWDSRENQVTESNLELYDQQIIDAYDYYYRRHPGIFTQTSVEVNFRENPELGLRATPLPIVKFIDHDATSLLLISLGMLHDEAQRTIWSGNQRFQKVQSIKIKYDLREFTHDAGAIYDIAKLVNIMGGPDSTNFEPLPRLEVTSEDFFNQFELDYLAGDLFINFNDPEIQNALRSAFVEPKILFEKLYRLHLLGAQFWPAEMKKSLRSGSFLGGIKKPQKWKSPIQVTSLKLSDGESFIEFDDLSDGEAQLVQILAITEVYKHSRSLFLLDEPETHLNPFWRTYFHSYLNKIINNENNNQKLQFLISTHSPFMISSLKKNSVFHFQRHQDGLIEMIPVESETYGASFDVLIKELFGLRSLISQSVIDEIREQIELGNDHAKEWIESNLGLSPERAYLINKLSQ